MCEPATIMMTVAVVSSLGGMGMTMYGQRQQGKATDAAGKYNAKMDELKAESVGEQASFEARQRIDQNRRDVSLGLVSAAGSGLSLSSGSVLDWEGDMADAMGTDLAAIQHNASLQQWGLRSSANLSRAEGKFARKAANWQMGATALSSVGQIAGGMASFNQAGKARE
jgi:hypothetical protein